MERIIYHDKIQFTEIINKFVDSSDSEAMPNDADESSEDQWDETEEEVEEDEEMDVAEGSDDDANDN